MRDEQTFTGLRLHKRYVLDQPLARGALCVVYRGQDETLSRQIAVKAVPPAHVAVYRDALQKTSTLTHPSGVFVLDALEHDGHLFLIQEYVNSTSLTAHFKIGLDVARALDVGLQLTRYLAYAHVHDMIHGDLTPAAVLVERNGVVRLNNFAMPPDDEYFSRLMGTEALLAHAQGLPVPPDDTQTAPGPSPADDVRAVGLLLWQALATPAPAGEQRDFRADVAASVRGVVTRMVVRGHPDRLVSADDAVSALEELAREQEAMRETDLQPTPSVVRSWREIQPAEGASPWADAETVFNAPAWSTAETPLGTTPAVRGSAYDAPPVRQGPASGPLYTGGPIAHPQRTPTASGPLRAPVPSGPLYGGPVGSPRSAPPSRPVRGGQTGIPQSTPLSGPVRPYAPASQPGSYRPSSPIPWSDDPQMAQWASGGSSRPLGMASRTGKLGPAPRRRGMGVVTVVLIGLILFLLAFLVGYFGPHLIP